MKSDLKELGAHILDSLRDYDKLMLMLFFLDLLTKQSTKIESINNVNIVEYNIS